MMDGKRKVGEEFSPMGLMIGKFGCMMENFEILMIREDFGLMGTTFKVVSPFMKSFDNGEKFSIINVVILLSFNE